MSPPLRKALWQLSGGLAILAASGAGWWWLAHQMAWWTFTLAFWVSTFAWVAGSSVRAALKKRRPGP